MTADTAPRTARRAWKALAVHDEQVRELHLRQLVAADPARGERLTAERLTPAALGTLVALYEHSLFTQGVLWPVDSFDPWGVELGKVLAQQMIPELESKMAPALGHDSSTHNLSRRYRTLKEA
jgi:glucose-6-phosphate isomerase